MSVSELSVSDDLPLPRLTMVRQPIFDASLKVFAYKLVYFDEQSTSSAFLVDSTVATEFILDEYTSIHEAGENKRLPAWVTLPTSTATELNTNARPDELVVELDARTATQPAFAKAVEHLVSKGYQVSLEYFDFQPETLPILKLMSVIRFDVNRLEQPKYKKNIGKLLGHKRILCLAENIDTVELLEKCSEMGFDMFQGSFLSQPTSIAGEGSRRIDANQSSALQLVSALQKPGTTPEEIENIIQADPSLMYRLLRIVNSAAYSLVREITSIADTVVVLGHDQVRQLAMIVAMSNQSDKPSEMFRSLLVKARMCELLAKQTDSKNKGAYFLASVMSGLHLLLDTSMTSLLEQVPVTDDIRAAVLEGQGPIGDLLNQTGYYVEGYWDRISPDLDMANYDDVYSESLHWVNDVMGTEAY
ncbi:MAG: EAL and modified HD-GYP domain-containing signal transduction protein [Candidatus Azotimanducaceae bacterium]|jgi:EAL and modified HD-GYP domain-containing signal transduction protein